jgi:DNA-binding NtrC family response regulator
VYIWQRITAVNLLTDERDGPMTVAAVSPRNSEFSEAESIGLHKSRATVLVATNDLEIQGNMSELLAPFSVRTVWSRGMEEVKHILARQNVSVCFCGFWLLDGTYRDVVRYLRLRRAEIPAVIVCAPSCPHDYRDYLAALNISVFDFICHPYRKTDIERILNSAGKAPSRSPSPIPPISGARASGLRKAS